MIRKSVVAHITKARQLVTKDLNKIDQVRHLQGAELDLERIENHLKAAELIMKSLILSEGVLDARRKRS